MLGGVEDEQDVGDAGDGQGDEGGVDDGDEEEADVAETDDGVMTFWEKAPALSRAKTEASGRACWVRLGCMGVETRIWWGKSRFGGSLFRGGLTHSSR